MATHVIDILSGKQYIFNKTFGTSSGGTATPIWGGIGGIITNQVDLMNLFATKVSNSTYSGYTATTNSILNHLDEAKLEISAFTGYSASTDLRISALINDYNHYDIEANILTLNPSGYTDEKFWSTDTKKEFISEFVQTIGGHRWINTSLLYNPNTDTFYLGETADGQTQNLGQEIFINTHNTTTSNISTNNPKVFLCVGANTLDEQFMDAILARADDISDSSIYGLNTTYANVNGYFKTLTYGLLNNVNTSDWPIGTELYISDITRGELTPIKPENNAHVIAFVLKQHNSDGIMFVNTIRSIPNIDSLIPIAFDYSYFNGDLITTSAGTFYLNLRNDKGTVSASTQTVLVPDNTISGLTRDSLSIVLPTDINYTQGTYRGKFEISVDIGQANEKIYLEVYKADEFGNVIDSEITGETLGSLGVKPFLKLSSSILNLQANTITPIIVDGLLKENSEILKGQRFRFHILCEKVGGAGGNKTFTVHYGSNYDTWLRFPHYMMLDELYDVNTYSASAGTFLKKGSNGIWTGEYINYFDIKTNITILSGNSYSATTSDYIIGVNSTTGTSANIHLLPISTCSKTMLIIKDQGYNSSINNINVIPFGMNRIEKNQTSASIAIDGGSISIYNNGVNNWYIF